MNEPLSRNGPALSKKDKCIWYVISAHASSAADIIAPSPPERKAITCQLGRITVQMCHRPLSVIHSHENGVAVTLRH